VHLDKGFGPQPLNMWGSYASFVGN
jgi:hypothetical protein